jgi:hypothetical protein
LASGTDTNPQINRHAELVSAPIVPNARFSVLKRNGAVFVPRRAWAREVEWALERQSPKVKQVQGDEIFVM